MKSDTNETNITETAHRPLVSVIIPAYNSSEYIDEALTSVKNQTLSDIEVIVVDDCSTDKTAEIAKRYTADTRFTLIHRSVNGGVSAAQNTGVREATGEWIALLGCDDVWLPNKLESQLALFDEHPDAALLFANGVEFNEAGDIGPFYTERRKFPSGNVLTRLLRCNCFWASSVLVKRHSLLAAGLFEESISVGEDYFVWLKVLADGGSAWGVWEPVVRYRKRSDSLTSDKIRAYHDLERVHSTMLNYDITPVQRATLLKSIKRDRRDQRMAAARQRCPRRWNFAKLILRAWLCYPNDLNPLFFLFALALPGGMSRTQRKLARKW